MTNSTKGILAFFGTILSGSIILAITALLLITPAEMVSIGGVIFLVLASVITLVGLSAVGVHTILHRKD